MFKGPIAALCASLLILPVLAKDEVAAPTRAELLEHPEVSGALAAIDAWIDGVYMYERIPGISVGIVRGQDLLWSSGYGYSNIESKRPADSDTIYSVCSISKLFTAVGVMQLRDEGKLRLRDSVKEHLEWFDIEQAHEGSGPITIESLLTHSSGLPRESDFPYWNDPDYPFPTRDQIVERLDSQETLYPSQRYFQYSNLALSLAGEIVEARSGQPYDEYIQSRILQPLGLSQTRTYFPDDLLGEAMATGYTGIHRDQRREPVKPFFARGIAAAAGFTSTVNDLARFASWQFRLLDDGDDEILAANTLREMQRVHWVDPDWQTTWGLGFNVRQSGDMTIASHGGGCPGYITSFTMAPAKRLAVVVLTNAGDGSAGNMAINILNTIAPAIKDAASPGEDEMPDYSIYEGNFEWRPWGGELAIRQWGDRLVAISIPGNDLEDSITWLEHVSDNIFVRLTDNEEQREQWLFETRGGGKASRILRHSGYMERID